MGLESGTGTFRRLLHGETWSLSAVPARPCPFVDQETWKQLLTASESHEAPRGVDRAERFLRRQWPCQGGSSSPLSNSAFAQPLPFALPRV